MACQGAPADINIVSSRWSHVKVSKKCLFPFELADLLCDQHSDTAFDGDLMITGTSKVCTCRIIYVSFRFLLSCNGRDIETTI